MATTESFPIVSETLLTIAMPNGKSYFSTKLVYLSTIVVEVIL